METARVFLSTMYDRCGKASFTYLLNFKGKQIYEPRKLLGFRLTYALSPLSPASPPRSIYSSYLPAPALGRCSTTSPASKASFVGLIKSYDKQTDHYKVTYTRKIGVDGSLSKAFFDGSLKYEDMWAPDKEFKGGYFIIKFEHTSFSFLLVYDHFVYCYNIVSEFMLPREINSKSTTRIVVKIRQVTHNFFDSTREDRSFLQALTKTSQRVM